MYICIYIMCMLFFGKFRFLFNFVIFVNKIKKIVKELDSTAITQSTRN